jgi:AraC-like DNA-binding protein
MQMKKFLLLSFLLLFVAWQVQAQSEKEKELRQIEQQIASGELSDEDIAEKYEYLMGEYSTIAGEKAMFWFREAMAFAREKKSLEFEAGFLGQMGYVYKNLDERDSALLYFDNALKLIQGKDFYRQESVIYGKKGDFLSDISLYEEAIVNFLKAMDLNDKDKSINIRKNDEGKIAKNLRNEVATINNMAFVYYNQYNKEKCLECMLRAKKIMDDNPSVDFFHHKSVILTNLSLYYLDKNDGEKAFPFIEEGYQLAVKENNTLNIMYGLQRYGAYYNLQKDYKTMLRYDKEALQIAEEMGITYHINLAKMRVMNTYYDLKDYKTALSYEEYLLLNVPEDDWANLKKVYACLMRIYALTGNKDKTDEYFDKYIAVVEKTSDKNMQNAIQELEVKYEVDKHVAEKERNRIEKERNRNYFLFALAGCILLGVALGIWIYYNRTIVKKNRGLYRQIKEQDRLAEKLDAMTKQYEQVEQLMPEAVEGGDGAVETLRAASLRLPGNRQQRQLVSRMHEFLLKDRYFTQCDLDIQKIILQMTTNRTSLFEAFKAVVGKTPMEYINRLRLDEAKRLLDNSALTIEAIAMDCGFGTSNTFYRQFRECYRITPTEYRRVAKTSAD